MIRIIKNNFALSIALTLVLTSVLAPTAWVSGAAPYRVSFITTGLPAGVSFTIVGEFTNNGGKLKEPYSLPITSPGPATLNTEPGTSLSYQGFPSQVEVSGQFYWLLSVTPMSPMTTGAAGDSTNVTAEYATSCNPPEITTQPASATVVVGDPITFTVSASGIDPLTYQWRKDSVDILGATDTSYSIASVHTSDAGSYDVLVSNTTCSPTPATSDPAVLTVNKANQSITVTTNAPASAEYNTSFTVAATASSGLPVSYSASGVCTNVGATFTMTSGTGTCTVHYNQAGDADYNQALEVTEDVTADKADQTITVTTNAPASAEYNTSFTVAATASSGLPVSYSASGVCTNVGATFTMTSGTGTCTVHYNQAGDANYNEALEATEDVTAEKASQTITFVQPPSPAYVFTTFVVNPTASSGLPVTLVATGSCSNVGFQVTMTSATGTCTLTASQEGNADYLLAPDVVRSVAASPYLTYLPILTR